jgi:hypothetical protein
MPLLAWYDRDVKRRLRRIIFWTSVLSFVLSCALFAASLRWTAFFMAQFGDSVAIKSGGFVALWTSQSVRDQLVQSHGMSPNLEWKWHALPRKARVFWWPIVGYGQYAGHFTVWFQFWPLILVSATGVAWTFPRRRFGPGRCPSCGYRLDGLPDNTCPECGSGVST